jgi:hypothetical protein
LIKGEFPNMKSQERQMIVKDRWRKLSEKEKVIFVIKARIEEEKLNYSNVKAFYQQRIEFAKSLNKDKFFKEATENSTV